MYKLLPPETREKVKSEYLMRRAVVMVLAIILVEIVALVGLLPSYVLSKARQNEAVERGKMLASNLGDGEEDLTLWLESLNTKLKILSPKLDNDRPAQNLSDVIKQKGAGVKLTGFTWSKVEGKTQLAVVGVARDRQALLSFESRLNASGEFSAVTFPVSNLAKDKDISFELTLAKPQ